MLNFLNICMLTYNATPNRLWDYFNTYHIQKLFIFKTISLYMYLFWSQFIVVVVVVVVVKFSQFFFFSRTTGPHLIKPGTKHCLVKGIHVCANEDHIFFQGEIITKEWKSQKHWANFNQTWHKTSLGEGNSRVFKYRIPPFSKGN